MFWSHRLNQGWNGGQKINLTFTKGRRFPVTLNNTSWRVLRKLRVEWSRLYDLECTYSIQFYPCLVNQILQDLVTQGNLWTDMIVRCEHILLYHFWYLWEGEVLYLSSVHQSEITPMGTTVQKDILIKELGVYVQCPQTASSLKLWSSKSLKINGFKIV